MKKPVVLNECDDFPPPDEMEQGVMYLHKTKPFALHLCLCGCGELCMLKMDAAVGWTITNKEKLSITPSILQGEGYACRSHYIITNGVANFV